MAVQRQLPGPATANPERIQSRPYESNWARLPEEEIQRIAEPGGGPYGGLDDGVQWPVVLVVVAVAVLFLTFFVRHWITLALGLVLLVVAGVWRALTSEAVGSGHGVGPITVSDRRRRARRPFSRP